jgi:hypothetical protein
MDDLRFAILVAVVFARPVLGQPAQAPAAAPAPAASAASPSERMERAIRQAARTLQVIQRDGLVDARGPSSDKSAGKASAAAARPTRVPPEPTAQATAAAAATEPAQASPPRVSTAAAAEAVADPPGGALPPAAMPLASSPIASVVLPLAAVPAAASPAAAPAPPAAPAAARASMRLVNMVEPEIPGRLLARLSQPSRFGLVVDVREDGSVGAVELRSGSPRSFEPMILAAVRQWRYEPTGRPVRQTVDLVIKPGD